MLNLSVKREGVDLVFARKKKKYIFLEKTIPRIKDETPVEEWVNAIKNDTLPLSNFEYSAGLTEMALLGCLAQRFNADLKYNADKMKITNRKDVNAFLKPPARKGWSYGEQF